MKKRNDPYEKALRVSLGLTQELEALSFAKSFMQKNPSEIDVFGLSGDSGSLRWLEYGCASMTRLEAPDSLLREHCKKRNLKFVPPVEYDNVNMLRGSYYIESGLKHIRRERFNMFDADSESGPSIQLRMLEPAIASAMQRGDSLVIRNNMYGWARGRSSGTSWWAADNMYARQKFVRQYRYMLPNHVSVSNSELNERAMLNAAAFLIKIAQYADQVGGIITFHSRDFYKPEPENGKDKPTIMCPSIFGIQPR